MKIRSYNFARLLSHEFILHNLAILLNRLHDNNCHKLKSDQYINI